jgi:hypothetical protein
MRIIGTLVALAFAFGVSACGGSSGDGSGSQGNLTAANTAAAGDQATSAADASSDEDAVKAVIRAYTNALADHDGDAACAELTDELQLGLVREVSAELPSVKTCGDAVEAGAQSIGQDQLEQLRNPDFVSVTVNGPNATVGLQGGGSNVLTKNEDQWLIADLGGAG